jgi:very-short-patch-repair endonuclease
MTEPERRLWSKLRNSQLGVKFRRQHPIGSYIVDFYSEEKRLVIELDGETHASDQQYIYDEKRTKYLNSQKIKVIRFTNTDVMKNFDTVLEAIIFQLNVHADSLAPSGSEGRGLG